MFHRQSMPLTLFLQHFAVSKVQNALEIWNRNIHEHLDRIGSPKFIHATLSSDENDMSHAPDVPLHLLMCFTGHFEMCMCAQQKRGLSHGMSHIYFCRLSQILFVHGICLSFRPPTPSHTEGTYKYTRFHPTSVSFFNRKGKEGREPLKRPEQEFLEFPPPLRATAAILLSADMCTGACSRCIAVTLYPLALISIICNIVLFFPDGDIKYAKDGHITEEVKYMGGLIGGGVMVLLPALYIHVTRKQGCCGNRCGMFLSIAFAAVGVAGALYSLSVAALGLKNGPLCKVILIWTTPFKDSDPSYLTDNTWWGKCTEPKNIVQFNTGLFGTLLACSCLQAVLCAIQMINGLAGCLCGTCASKTVI